MNPRLSRKWRQRKAVKWLTILIREGGRILKAVCITTAKSGVYRHSTVRIAHYTMVYTLSYFVICFISQENSEDVAGVLQCLRRYVTANETVETMLWC